MRATYGKLLASVLDLFDLDLRKSFDLEQSLRSGADKSLEGGISHEHLSEAWEKLTPTVWMPFCFNLVISAALTPSIVSKHVENMKMTDLTMILDFINVNDTALLRVSK